MSERDDLAEVIGEALGAEANIHDTSWYEDCAIADMILDAGYRKPRTVTTLDELDALPTGTVVMDGDGDVHERMSFGWSGIIKEEGAEPWLLRGAENCTLPATVLHVPS